VEIKQASSLVVSLDKALNRMPLHLSGKKGNSLTRRPKRSFRYLLVDVLEK